MILYSVKDGKYYNIDGFKQDLSDMEEKGFARKVYVNLTNRCTCACTFCLRNTKEMNEHNNLWIERNLRQKKLLQNLKNMIGAD